MMEEEELSFKLSSHILTDGWTLDDKLGYRLYAYALARFLTHPETHPPICISIQSPWGVGKTTLMRLLQMTLDRNAISVRENKEVETETKNDSKHNEMEDNYRIRDIKSG